MGSVGADQQAGRPVRAAVWLPSGGGGWLGSRLAQLAAGAGCAAEGRGAGEQGGAAVADRERRRGGGR